MEQVKDHKANYNHLKRKLEDLEEVHKEGKRFVSISFYLFCLKISYVINYFV